MSGEIGDAAIAARFLVGRGGDLDGAAKAGAGGDEGLGGDDGGGQPALHVAGAAPVDAATVDFAAEGVAGPAMADLDHVVMAVEMDAVARAGALHPRDEVPARMAVAVARRAIGHGSTRQEKPAPPSRAARIIADIAVVQARRVQRRNPDQIPGQRDQRIASGGDPGVNARTERIGHGSETNACQSLSATRAGGRGGGPVRKGPSRDGTRGPEPKGPAGLSPVRWAGGAARIAAPATGWLKPVRQQR